ncbi:predicted protein [Streptomyces sp. AA4]|nr:predicted protein [Streptomyces sp. AA4]
MSAMAASPSQLGLRFTDAEAAALARLHQAGLRSRRYDRLPQRVTSGRWECPCTLTGSRCPAAGDPLERHCADGEQALAGQDHPDRWYRNGCLVAVVHYPYGMDHDELTTAAAACTRLGLNLDIDARWAIHACDLGTLAVVISHRGIGSIADRA